MISKYWTDQIVAYLRDNCDRTDWADLVEFLAKEHHVLSRENRELHDQLAKMHKIYQDLRKQCERRGITKQ